MKRKIRILMLAIGFTLLLTGCVRAEEMESAITSTDPEGEHTALTENDMIRNLASAVYFIYKAADTVMQKTPDGFYTVPAVVELKSGIASLAQGIMAILLIVQMVAEIDRKGDDFRWQDGAKIGAEFIFLKMLIDLYDVILAAMLDSGTKLVTAADASLADTLCEITSETISGFFADADTAGIWKWVLETISILGAGLILIVLLIIGMVIEVIIICRLVQLALMTTLAALPISFLVWRETRDIAKRFFLSYFAISLQAAVLCLIFGIYGYLDGTFMAEAGVDGMLGHFISLVILAVSVTKSGTWAKELLGVS